MSIDTNAGYTATLATNCGAVTIALDAARAPRTVNSFVFLAGEQYFDHTKCHRITTEGIYVLQCGDPTATGMGGPGYQFPDENLAGATYPAGTIAMANAGPGTNGSQFFVVYRDAPLPPSYTPFGRVTAGMDVLTSIAAAGVKDGSSDGEPTAGVVLDSVSTGRN
ncbi:peptidylprolyl isomerase [Nocardia beijingensis]|nr:peptidylprolyl isomerase [Nocardia beijingensis]